jgi:putative oxidoreductase
MDTGLLILRVVVGLLFVGHGTQKLFGWFGGYGLEGTGGFMESLGYHPGRRHASLAGMTETVGGGLLVLGLFTPLAAAMIIGVMVNAIMSVHRPNGMWNTDGGMEFPLVLATAAATTAFTGAGGVSLDAALDWDLSGWGWGLAAVALGCAVGGLVVASRRPAPAPAAEPTPTAVTGTVTADTVTGATATAEEVEAARRRQLRLGGVAVVTGDEREEDRSERTQQRDGGHEPLRRVDHGEHDSDGTDRRGADRGSPSADQLARRRKVRTGGTTTSAAMS